MTYTVADVRPSRRIARNYRTNLSCPRLIFIFGSRFLSGFRRPTKRFRFIVNAYYIVTFGDVRRFSPVVENIENKQTENTGGGENILSSGGGGGLFTDCVTTDVHLARYRRYCYARSPENEKARKTRTKTVFRQKSLLYRVKYLNVRDSPPYHQPPQKENVYYFFRRLLCGWAGGGTSASAGTRFICTRHFCAESVHPIRGTKRFGTKRGGGGDERGKRAREINIGTKTSQTNFPVVRPSIRLGIHAARFRTGDLIRHISPVRPYLYFDGRLSRPTWRPPSRPENAICQSDVGTSPVPSGPILPVGRKFFRKN